ncbi:hypothetical protein CHS0354_041149 [Potamilus streckersoni]|uniref:Amine oxidase n=1 Tax=Potamilus streckersoni TaxID=2493646 RepID=A0AAE0SE87_9BIVA|nr:hypothetical protein CHS0354_041149 [Potamilus streckersoni]
MGKGRMKRRNAQNRPEQNQDISKSSEDDQASKIPLTKGMVMQQSSDVVVQEGKDLFILKLVAIISSFLSVILLICVIILAHYQGHIPYCFSGFNVIPRDLTNPTVFEDLNPSEYMSVVKYMLKNTHINLVPFEDASVNSSYIYMIDLHMPLKSAVLKYLDRGTKKPERAAKVVVIRGDVKPPRVEEYLVFPLPVPDNHKLVSSPAYSHTPIPYSSRPVDYVDYKSIYPIFNHVSEQLYHLMIDSYGLCYHNCTKGKNCLVFYDVAPRGRKSGDRESWFWAFRDVEGFYLHPLGLEIQIDHISTDVNEWKVSRIVYNGYLFYEVEHLVERYRNNTIRKIKFDQTVGLPDQIYSSFHKRGKSPTEIPLQGPRIVEPQGRRFQIQGRHVTFMHWDLDIRMRSSTGVQLFDIRFQKERIAYEISLQEASVFYSGFGPAQGTSNYYDTSRMMGASSFELVPGIDCPETAVYLDTHHLVNSGRVLHYKNAICVFENNPSIPLRRHYTNDFRNGYTSYGGLVDYQLIVRNIANIWNYDYIFDYIFHLNGAIEIQVATTGYVQATYKLPYEKEYGNTIYYNAIANIHQHLFHFKVDLDIAGTKNRYATIDIGTKTDKSPWYRDAQKTQHAMIWNVRKKELDSVVGNSMDDLKYHIIFNDEFKNKFGSSRSYRIINRGATEFLLKDTDVAAGAKWAKYPIAVTMYKDWEEMSSSIYAQNDPWYPVVDFERFLLDNDTIFDEDIVVWLTMGAHHIPHSEDVPSTPTVWNKYNIFLAPYNFFNECPSTSSTNIVHILPAKDYKTINVNTFGTSLETKCAPFDSGPQSYSGVRTEV